MEGKRAIVFIDGSNFDNSTQRLSVRSGFSKRTYLHNLDFKRLAQELTKACHANSLAGARYYCSLPPNNTHEDKRERKRLLKRFGIMNSQGFKIDKKDRKPRAAPICKRCVTEFACPKCKTKMAATSKEKGVDSGLITDLIGLAWDDAYDVAVLISNDSDFCPAIEFLLTKGKTIVDGSFPTLGGGIAVSNVCSFSINLETIIPKCLMSAKQP